MAVTKVNIMSGMRKFRFLSVGLFAMLAVLIFCNASVARPESSSQSSRTAKDPKQPAKKWAPHIEIEAKPGNDREVGKLDFFYPWLQTKDSMLFSLFRGVLTDDTTEEGNFGLGYRKMINGGPVPFIWGFYGFYDIKNSENDNRFEQLTLGAELMTENTEFRFNRYFADDKVALLSSSSAGGGNAISLAGVNVVSGLTAATVTTRSEFTLPGWDVEAGLRLPLLQDFSPWIYAGWFHFQRNGIEVEGPRARIELPIEKPFGWDDVEMTLGAEVRDDDVRGTDGFGFARLRIKFGGDEYRSPDPLTAFDKRMTRRVIRDTDINTQTATTTKTTSAAGPTSAVTDAGSGQSLQVFHVANTAQGTGDCSSSANACLAGTALGAAGTGDIIVPVSVGGTIVVAIPLNAQRQQLVGAGDTGSAAITLSDATGNILNLAGLGARATVRGTVTLDTDNTIGGFNINNTGGTGVLASGNVGTTANFSDMTVRGTSNGIRFTGASSGTATFASDVALVNNGGVGDSAFEIEGGTADITYSGNITQSGSTQDAVEIRGGHTGTVTFQTGTILATNGEGLRFDNADGTYNFNGTATMNGGDAGIDIENNSGGTFTFGANTSIITPTGTSYEEHNSTANVTYNGSISHLGSSSVVNIGTKTAGTTQFTGLVRATSLAAHSMVFGGNNGGTIIFDNVDIDTTTGSSISATGANTNLTISGTMDVANNANRTFQFNSTSGNYDFSGVTSTDSGIAQVFNATESGTYNLGNHTATTPGASALTITSTTVDVTYESLTVAGTNTTDDAIQIDDASGSLTINGGTIRSDVRGIDLQNDGGVVNNFTLTTAGTQFQVGNDGIFAETTSAGSTLNVNVSGITATSNIGAQAVEVEWDDGGGQTTIANNVIDSGTSGAGLIELDNNGSGTVTATLTNNNISGSPTAGEIIDIRTNGTATTNVTITGGTLASFGTGGGAAIDLTSDGVASTLRATVSGVTINGTGSTGSGIIIEAASAGEIDATLTNNVIQNFTAGSGILVQHQAGSTGNACLNATGNSNGAGGVPASGGAGNNAFRFDDGGTGATMDIAQASVVALGLANNGGGGGVTVTTGAVTFGATCQTP